MGDSARLPGAGALRADLPLEVAAEAFALGDAFDREALAVAEQSAEIGVWSIDLATQRVRGTAQFWRILGLPPSAEGVPVDAVRALLHPDDRERVVAGFHAALEGGQDADETVYRIVRPDGDLRWICGRGRVIRDPDDHPLRYSGVDLDITKRKETEAALTAAQQALTRMSQELEARVRERTAELETEAARRVEAEARLHQAQKMEAVGNLTGGIAHDFSNILQVIMGNLEITRIALQRGSAFEAGGATAREMIERATATAERSAQSAKQLIQRLLAFGRQQPLAPTVVDLNTLVEGMADMMDRALGDTIRMQTRLAAHVPPLMADRNQLESALLNLVVNARDAMPHGGELVVATGDVELRDACTDDLAPGHYALLTVQDTGDGIAAEHLQRVFEPFFTTKGVGKGSGLGLSMVYGFVEQSGGQVRIQSTVGEGTTVRLFLPAAQSKEWGASERDATQPLPVLAPANDGETVLVVEDDDEVRRFAVTALSALGYRVTAASDGTSALAAADATRGRLDLLFTDVVLPGTMGGADLADALRARRPELPVLFASGNARSVLAQGGGMSHVRLLDKPYSIETLARSCRHAIDWGRQPAPGA